MIKTYLALLVLWAASSCSQTQESLVEAEPTGRGPYAVGSTNMEVAPEYAGIGDAAMHGYLLGAAGESGEPRFVADLLRYPDSAWVIDVPVPADQEIYGPARGLTLPVVTFVAFPSESSGQPTPYAFPYHESAYGIFEDMLGPDEAPMLADSDEKYPLIVLAHGAAAHGIFDIGHAQNLASHGFIVAVITYGDDRTGPTHRASHHVSFLRPFLTKAVIDSLVKSESFGPYLDADNIGITGHSFGGFTALALAGGHFQGHAATVSDDRVKAAVAAAPWVGGNYDGDEFFAFGPKNTELNRVDVPVISFFGTKDEVTLSSYILPAMQQLSGPTYVVELVDQPHVFEPGSWEDRDNWELLFYRAYLKHDPAALATLNTARSMRGGNEDVQRFDYQKLPANE